MGRDGRVVPADPQVAAVKKKPQPAVSWFLVDTTGQSTILDADKQSIMNRVQIHARDLRILDPVLSYPSPILVRDRAIILNLEHIKAIITAEEILLRDPLDENVIPVVSELLRRLHPVNTNSQGQGDGKAFLSEHNDVEASEEDELALEAICSFLDARTTELEAAAYPALDKLASKVRDELEQILDDDYDMADLYLSRKLTVPSSPVKVSGRANWFSASPAIASRISRASQVSLAALGSRISRASRASMATVGGNENDVEELEMLLEAYFMQSDITLNKLTLLREYIDDSEDYINIQLDNHQNQLIQFFLSSGTVCLSVFSFVAGIFGMNIPFTWNNGYGYAFEWVVIITGVFCAALFVLIMSYARYKGLVGS